MIAHRYSKFLLLLVAGFSMVSCNHVYKEYDRKSFPTYIWRSGQEIVFKPKIENKDKTYELTLGLRHVYGLRLNSIAVRVRRIAPSGKETIYDYDIQIRNSRNEYISSCGGDLCDLEKVVDSNVRFEETGEYQFIVTHNLQLNRIPGIMEFGLIIDEMD